MAPSVDINLVAVLVAAVGSMIIGALWYSPLAFGKLWMQLSGMTAKDLGKTKKKSMGKHYVAMFASTLIMSYVLAHFVGYAEATTVLEGMQAGFWLWLGFIATVMLGIVLWEGKPFRLYVLKVTHYLVTLLFMGAVLAAWP